MNVITRIPCAVFLGAAVTLIGCGSYDDDDGGPIPPPPPPPAQTDFTTLIKNQFAATADNTDPVQIDDLNIVFADQDNPAAFDDLLTF